jgi:WD40 repeat protein
MGFSPDGRRLASAAHDGTVKLWDTATGREILTLLHGSNELLTAVSFSPDGRQIVSTSMSGTVKVWDATPLPEMGPVIQSWSTKDSPNGSTQGVPDPSFGPR